MRFLKLVPWLFMIAAVAVAATLLRVERLAAAEPPAVVDRIRDVQRLEVLEVTVHQKLTFAPDPKPQPTLLAGVLAYARESVAPRRGRAIVFAEARFFVDLRRLKSDQVVVNGDEVTLTLPEPEVETSLLPAETEVIASNLDSAETAQLLDDAQRRLQGTVAADAKLRQRAREAAARTMTGLLKGFGFRRVSFAQSTS
jgi:hypothetical protein